MLLTYRSPLIAALMFGVVAVAYLIATGAVYGLVQADVTTVSGQSTAILIVLMFGAGTDYCLLIVSRFRDELRRGGEVEAAMARAAARTGPAIFASRRDRGGGDARAEPRGLQRDARDGSAARARDRRDDGVRADAAAGAAGRVRAARVLARDPARRARRAAGGAGLDADRRASSGAARCCSRRCRPRCSSPGALGNLGGRGYLDLASSTATRPSPSQAQQLIRERFDPPGRVAPLESWSTSSVALEVKDALRAAPGVATVQHRLRRRRLLISLEVLLEGRSVLDGGDGPGPALRAVARQGGRRAAWR